MCAMARIRNRTNGLPRRGTDGSPRVLLGTSSRIPTGKSRYCHCNGTSAETLTISVRIQTLYRAKCCRSSRSCRHSSIIPLRRQTTDVPSTISCFPLGVELSVEAFHKRQRDLPRRRIAEPLLGAPSAAQKPRKNANDDRRSEVHPVTVPGMQH